MKFAIFLVVAVPVAAFFSGWGFPYNLPLCLVGGLAAGAYYAHASWEKSLG